MCDVDFCVGYIFFGKALMVKKNPKKGKEIPLRE